MNGEINDLAGLRWALGGTALAAGMSGDLSGCEVAVAALGSRATTDPVVRARPRRTWTGMGARRRRGAVDSGRPPAAAAGPRR